jgi:hypothetical protein
MLNMRKRERADTIKRLLDAEWNVFGTLKFVDGRRIGSASAAKIIGSYWNRVDRVFFGRAAERQKVRVPRWCFAHTGWDSENLHIHFALLSPVPDHEQACTVLNALWSYHHRQTAPLEKNWITPVQDRVAVARYLTREYWRLGAASFLDQYSWSSTDTATIAQYQHLTQARRIHHQIGSEALQQAQQAYQQHKANTQAQSPWNQFEERG